MSLVTEIDYGTPAARSDKMVTLTIDGIETHVPEGTSIMWAAMEVGTKIPKLCATDMLESFGSASSRSRAVPGHRLPAQHRSHQA